MKLTSTAPNLVAAALATTLACGAAMAAPKVQTSARHSGTTVRDADPVRQIIVRYKDESARAHAAGVDGNRLRALSDRAGIALAYRRPMSDKAHVLRLPRPMSRAEAQAAVERLRADPTVAYAAIDERVFPHLVPNDPLFVDSRQSQWNLQTPSGERRGGANLPPAWDAAQGAGAVIAVLDTGIVGHPDLDFNILRGHDFVSNSSVANDGDARDADPADPGDWVGESDLTDPLFGGCGESDSSWHGTGVAGLVGALTNNGSGMAGIAFQSRVLAVRVLGKCGGSFSDITDAIRWAAGAPPSSTQTWPQLGIPLNPNPARIVNLSLGGSAMSCMDATQAAIDAARAAGAVIVVSTGNDGEISIATPANCRGVLAVTGHTVEADSADYANVGAGTSISAPGGGDCTQTTLNCKPNGSEGAPDTIWRFVMVPANSGVTAPESPTYFGVAGTSAAAPHVAGVAGLLFGRYPALTERQVRGLITSSAHPFPGDTYCARFSDGRCGAGQLDAGATLTRAATAVSTPLPAPVAAVLPASRSVTVGTAATVFATVINTGASAALGCEVAPPAGLTAGFWFQTTSATTNELTGIRNRPIDIPAGAAQSFVLSFTPSTSLAPTELALRFDCINAPSAPTTIGLNTLLLSSTTVLGPDVIALAATASGDGIVNVPGTTGTGAFAVATANVGAASAITVSADTGNTFLPVALRVCQTNSVTGACLASPVPSLTTTIAAGATPTFAVFAAGAGNIAFSPAANRVFVRFRDGTGQVRGATSVAIRTQ